MLIPGWVVALPVFFAFLGALAVLTWAPFEKRHWYLLWILAGIVLYFVATIPFRVPPENGGPGIFVGGPGVPT